MALANYTDLVASVVDWLDDAAMSTSAPDFIALAEARFNRVLRVDEMEKRATASLTGAYIALPDDFLEMRSVSLDGIYQPLEGISLSEMKALNPSPVAGIPRHYAITDTQIRVNPPPDGTYTIEMTYWSRIPALTSTSPTNWLLTAHPDLYLYGSLLQAELRGWNDARLPLIKAAHDEVLDQIAVAGARKQVGARPRLRHGVRGFC